MDFKEISEQIESDHYCGPHDVRLSVRIEQALHKAYALGQSNGLERAAVISEEIDGIGIYDKSKTKYQISNAIRKLKESL